MGRELMARKKNREQTEAAIQRASDARALIEEGVIGAAFRAVEQTAITRCRQALTASEAFNASLVLQVSEQVSQLLKAFIADGENAVNELDREQQKIRETRNDELGHTNYLTAARQARSELDNLTTAPREDAPNV